MSDSRPATAAGGPSSSLPPTATTAVASTATSTAATGEHERVWSEFSQTEKLTTRLHNILQDYPAGIGPFRELIQNADDAGARVVKICYDSRQHASNNTGTQKTGCSGSGSSSSSSSSSDASCKLLDPRLAAWQGPALLVFNDAVFTERDFQSITSLGLSGKKSDLSTVGKYGLGFNCVCVGRGVCFLLFHATTMEAMSSSRIRALRWLSVF